jgi:hypothetical protein
LLILLLIFNFCSINTGSTKSISNLYFDFFNPEGVIDVNPDDISGQVGTPNWDKHTVRISNPFTNVPNGGVREYKLRVWVKPSIARQIEVRAYSGILDPQIYAEGTINIPKANINPVVFVPGFGATWALNDELAIDPIQGIMYRSLDLAGNREEVKSLSLKLDKAPPVTQLSADGTQGNDGWYTSPVTFTLAALDNLSGVALVEYSLDEGIQWQPYTEPVVVATEGFTTIQYRSQDTAGNLEASASHDLKLDMTVPQADLEYSGEPGNNGWYRSAVTVAINAQDEVSGLAKIEYRLAHAALKSKNSSQ